jgi:integrase
MAILAECPVCHKKQTVRNKACKCGKDLDKAKRAQKVRYWVSYRLPGGKQRREPVAGANDPKAYSIDEARKAEGKRMAQKVETPRILQRAPEEKMSFQELTNWYLKLEKVKAQAYFPTLSFNLASFNKEFGSVIVSQIKPSQIENFQATQKAAGYSDSYVDQQVGAAKTVVNKAYDDCMVSAETVQTFRRVKKLLKRNSNARDKILSPGEFQRLMDNSPRHTKLILVTAFYTGMRKGEILSLTWDKLDLKKKVIKLEAQDTKDKEARTIPICDELLQVLSTIPQPIHDLDKKLVFAYRRKNRKGKGEDNPLADIRSGLEDACEKAGIPYGRFVKDGFIFHDLRHCFNTYMRKAGVAESVIMEITGHSTREMFDRYNTVDQDDRRQAVDQMSTFLRGVDQSVDQEAKNQ